jgi:hypothetical protein
VGVDVYAAREATAALAASRDGFSLESRRCTGCGRRARTLGFDAAQAIGYRPRCRMCAEAIGSDENPVFPPEGGVIHSTCFEAVRTSRALEGGSDLCRLRGPWGPGAKAFESPGDPAVTRVGPEAIRRLATSTRDTIRSARMTRERSEAVRRVSRFVRRLVADLREGRAMLSLPS